MVNFRRIFFILFIFSLPVTTIAQVNAVKFGKNRIQFKKFIWQYYQTKNFNVYYNQHGQEIAKFVAQSAEKELPVIEAAAEYSLQRRANIILYNEFADMQQTNIGLETNAITTGGVTKLVNNKMVIYYNADYANLKKQIKQGIGQILTQNILFGDDIGEVASNQTLLDLPQWLTDGYAAYLGENWSTDMDDQLKNDILSGNYSKFSSFSFKKPLLAGHAFWYFIEEKYKKENVTYFFYLARVYKNLNKASQQITKKKFKDLLKEFMEYEEEKYSDDIEKRRSYPKGTSIESFTISNRENYYRINVNPNKKNNSYVVTQFKKGIVRLLLNDDGENKTLLHYGSRTLENEINPGYPMTAWDPTGSRIAVVYKDGGKLKLFVYDMETGYKLNQTDLTNTFDQIQDIKYLTTKQTLLFSAVNNGHTDIFTYELEKQKLIQITNDVYDDLDASYVTFPGKSGIIFSSNRPSPTAKSADTVLPSNNRYNVFLITDYGTKPELNQITQLTNLKYGNARSPMQYNGFHFTFVSDENGIGNRYAGFFSTKKAGLDTMIIIGNDILRNPSVKQIDSTLKAQKKSDVDSIAVIAVSEDSTYTFPISNYESSIVETRIAGGTEQVTEVTQQSDDKTVYKLKIDQQALDKRNVSARPTEYMKKLMRESRLTKVGPAKSIKGADKKKNEIFQSEFESDTSKMGTFTPAMEPGNIPVLQNAKLYPYKPKKFSAEYGSLGLNNAVLVNRYQAYQNGSGPITLNSGTPLNGLISLGTSDLMEDIKFTGGFKLSTNLKDNEWLGNYQNLKRRIDWGVSYYRNVQTLEVPKDSSFASLLLGKVFTNLYQVNVAYPFNNNKSIRISTGLRSDKTVVASGEQESLQFPDTKKMYSVSHIEYVYDNSLNPAMNIWEGLRYKMFFDYNKQVSKQKQGVGPSTYNLGFDARYFYPIYRHFTWALRGAGDFSWGNQKMIYYLGGVDGWLMFGPNQKFDAMGNPKGERFFNTHNPPDADQDYAFQSLAVNMRGFIQNVANGNNALVINSEFRLPIISTFFDKTVNNAFIRNFQLIQFTDLGTAWNGKYDNFTRPTMVYADPVNNGQTPPVLVKIKAGGIGPFAGGYGFGARSTLLGYFLKFDAAWQMNGFFKGKPIMYFALGLDF